MVSQVLAQMCRLGCHGRHSLLEALNRRVVWTQLRHRVRAKIKEPDYLERISLRILGNGSHGNARGVCLTTDSGVYLFNCSEGIQRLIVDHKIRYSDVRHLFLTSNAWHNVSGISALLLSSFDQRCRQFVIHGHDCESVIDLCNFFDLKLKNISYTYLDYVNVDNEDNDNVCKQFKDKLLEVTGVPVIGHDRCGNKVVTIAYVCKLAAKPGIIFLDRCFHMKIPRHLVPQLERRESVALEDGRVINPNEVLSEDEPEKVFIICECPSIGFVETFVNNARLLDQISCNKDLIKCVVHFTPADCVNDDRYQSFMSERFSSSTHHLMINEQNPSFSLPAMHRFQSQLNCLDSHVFPLLGEKTEILDQIQSNAQNKQIISCQTGLQYILRPSILSGFNFDSITKWTLSQLKEEAIKSKDGDDRENFNEYLHELRTRQHSLVSPSGASYPELVILGTASSNAGHIRNVSAILVNTSDESSILLDCGTDTYGQMCRYFGVSNMQFVLEKLKAVFISHSHSDHHMGLLNLIKKYYHYTNKPLNIFATPAIRKWLNNYRFHFEDIAFMYSIYLTYSMHKPNANVKHILDELRLSELRTVPVIHSTDSHGIVLVTRDNNITIVYSGDAMPSETLYNSVHKCDLLIHEGTVEDSLLDFAQLYFHSTFAQALEVGRKMNADFTLLTHFSQRYGKLPLIADNAINDDQSRQPFFIAYDHMRISVPRDLNRLPILFPTLKCMYAKHYEKLLERNEVYRRRSIYND